eukprot:3520398-Pleurochrysis_carterae.AAC.1
MRHIHSGGKLGTSAERQPDGKGAMSWQFTRAAWLSLAATHWRHRSPREHLAISTASFPHLRSHLQGTVALRIRGRREPRLWHPWHSSACCGHLQRSTAINRLPPCHKHRADPHCSGDWAGQVAGGQHAHDQCKGVVRVAVVAELRGNAGRERRVRVCAQRRRRRRGGAAARCARSRSADNL